MAMPVKACLTLLVKEIFISIAAQISSLLHASPVPLFYIPSREEADAPADLKRLLFRCSTSPDSCPPCPGSNTQMQ